jgi:uncharacterized membrane protein YfcA
VSGSIANIRNQLLRPLDGVVIGAAAVVFSFVGAMLALLMSPVVSTLLFGIFVAATAIQLTYRAIKQQRSAR